MSLISYSQNFEDVMLWRALKHVEKGFYIDVGANDPVVDSVTKAFYDAGWRGVNIDPVSEWYEKLQQDRPEDINLQLAVGARKGSIDFYEVVGTGLSSQDELNAKKHGKEQDFKVKKHKVSLVRLTSICEQYAKSDIHFLKIDVEGAEESVLKGLDLKKIRPWIILVESTHPITDIEDYAGWEPFLLDADYEFVYFDGLNRFYIAKEHKEIKNNFILPPNIFDDFILSGTGSNAAHGYVSQIQRSLSGYIIQVERLGVKIGKISDALVDHQEALSSCKVTLVDNEEALENYKDALGASQKAGVKEHEYSKQLETEWDSASNHVEKLKVQLGDQSEVLKNVQNEWDAAKDHVEKLIIQLDEAGVVLTDHQVALKASKEDCIKEQAHSKHMQGDFAAARANHEQEMQNILNSVSWRVTRWLRWLLALRRG